MRRSIHLAILYSDVLGLLNALSERVPDHGTQQLVEEVRGKVAEISQAEVTERSLYAQGDETEAQLPFSRDS